MTIRRHRHRRSHLAYDKQTATQRKVLFTPPGSAGLSVRSFTELAHACYQPASCPCPRWRARGWMTSCRSLTPCSLPRWTGFLLFVTLPLSAFSRLGVAAQGDGVTHGKVRLGLKIVEWNWHGLSQTWRHWLYFLLTASPQGEKGYLTSYLCNPSESYPAGEKTEENTIVENIQNCPLQLQYLKQE